jgi:hypothetical protein
LNNPVNYIDLFGMAAARSNPEEDIHIQMDPVVVTARAPFDWNNYWWLRSGFFDTSFKGSPNDDLSRMEAALRNVQRMAEINTLFLTALLAQQVISPLMDFMPGSYFAQVGDMAWAERRYGYAMFSYTMGVVDMGLTVGSGGLAAVGKGAGSGLVKGGAKVGVIAAAKTTQGFRSFTRSNFRYNLGKQTGGIPVNSQAHHVFPQKYGKDFSRAGININDPRFGVWWNSTDHLKNAAGYNAKWGEFFLKYPNASYGHILNHGRSMMLDHGIHVLF